MREQDQEVRLASQALGGYHGDGNSMEPVAHSSGKRLPELPSGWHCIWFVPMKPRLETCTALLQFMDFFLYDPFTVSSCLLYFPWEHMGPLKVSVNHRHQCYYQILRHSAPRPGCLRVQSTVGGGSSYRHHREQRLGSVTVFLIHRTRV
ncbi:Hypothetical predicted protein [Marmota monax]|uniref:Uncharacterized protein n=1 Tax=Marmota monax TaxID=9995 RepID=A0A5E4CIM7_MARMO|nr:Hypothetical predicted protein [Marmota monax]